MSGVSISRVSVSDPLPSFNAFQIDETCNGCSNAAFSNISFADVSIANYSTVRQDREGRPLPHGIPNLLVAGGGLNVTIQNIRFLNVSLAGVSLRYSIQDPTIWNISRPTVSGVTVDGHPI